MKFETVEQVRKYIPEMFKFECIQFRGMLFEWNGKDLEFVNKMAPFQTYYTKNDFQRFQVQLKNPRNSGKLLKARRTMVRLGLTKASRW